MEKIPSLILAISLISIFGYIWFESEVTKAVTGDTAISLTVTGEININCSSTAALSPSIAGQSGGFASTTFGCNVETNDANGYNLKIKKDQKLQIADAVDQRFDDYTTTSIADFLWGAVGAGNEEFGFNISSTTDATSSIAIKYRDNGADCGLATSSDVTDGRCWNAIPTSPGDEEVANRSSATPAGGVVVRFGIQVEAGSSNNLEAGSYAATTTATALVNP